MKRIHIFCEGQTEETFVREVLRPHFDNLEIFLNPIIIRTSRRGKGGVSSYPIIKRQVENKCKEDTTALVTTMLDLYGLPGDFPSTTDSGSSIERGKNIENAFQADIGQPNFVANLVIHEFEGLLFSEPTVFNQWFDNHDTVRSLSQIRNKFDTPEHINDNRLSSPSKRILKICTSYDKVLHGTLISLDIGLESIRRECPLFDKWITNLENLDVKN